MNRIRNTHVPAEMKLIYVNIRYTHYTVTKLRTLAASPFTSHRQGQHYGSLPSSRNAQSKTSGNSKEVSKHSLL